jgi:hypothetical protein
MNRMKQRVQNNKSQGKEYRVPCALCLRETRHIVVQSVDVEGEALDWDFHFNDQYQIIQCQGCESVSFRKCYSDTESSVWIEERNEEIFIDKIEIYPTRVAGRHKLRQAHFLPFNVKQIYEETHSSLCNRQPILAGIGIRALIEAVCKQKGAKGRNLEYKIDSLVTLGVLTETGARILHKLRDLGNTAVHEVKPHSEETLGIAMDVVEHLLNDVYILPAVAESLPKRKSTTR